MHKDLTILGTHWQKDSSKTYVELDGELIEALCQRTTNGSYAITLKSINLFPVAVTFIMQAVRTKPSITVISYELRKILGKSGVR